MIKIWNMNDGVPGLGYPKAIRVDAWSGSPLGNEFHRNFPREKSIPMFKRWLWTCMQDPESDQMQELERLIEIYKHDGELILMCWCAPKPCHADVIKAALEWMMAVSE